MGPQHPLFFFSGWAAAARVLLVGTLAYLALLAMLRLAGKRTLGKMNVFDFIMTVAIGSTLANVLVSADVSLLDGLVAFAVLIGLQFAFAWATVRSARVERLVNGQPALLLHRGRFCHARMRRERVTEQEVRAAVRAAGAGRLEDVDAVVLETDGVISVLRQVGGPPQPPSALSDVVGLGEHKSP
jgi:uncharacterized membrane protein YcaP (DUF421 family)